MDYIEVSLEISPLNPGRDILVAELSQLEFESFLETEKGVMAYINAHDYPKINFNILPIFNNVDYVLKYSEKLIPNKNWNVEWESNFHPVVIDNRCMIRAPFHSIAKEIQYDLVISPKQAFGTGHHETTALMVSELMKLSLSDKKVMDLGCGTGILGILSVFCGSEHVVLVDNNDWAFQNCVENCKLNNIKNMDIIKGSLNEVAFMDFDVILANINRNALLEMISKFPEYLAINGHLLISGILIEDENIIKHELITNGFSIKNSTTKGKWKMIHSIKIK